MLRQRLQQFYLIASLFALLLSQRTLLPTVSSPETPAAAGGYEPVLQIGRGDIENVEWHPTGETLLVATQRGAWLYTPTLEEIAAFPAARFATFSPEGIFMAGVGADQQIRLWTADKQRLVKVLYGHEHPVIALHWSPQGDKLASLDEDGRLLVYDLKTAEITYFWFPHGLNFSWNRNGNYLAIWKYDTVSFWTVQTKDVVLSRVGDHMTVEWGNAAEVIYSFAGSEEEYHYWVDLTDPMNQIATGYDRFNCCGQPIMIRDGGYQTEDNLISQSFVNLDHVGGVGRTAWSSGNHYLAIGYWNTGNYTPLQIFDTTTNTSYIMDEAHLYNTERLIWSSKNILATVGRYGDLRIWTAQGIQLGYSADFGNLAEVIAWNSDHTRFAVANHTGQVQLWDIHGQHLATINIESLPLEQLAWQPNGTWLAIRYSKYLGDVSAPYFYLWDTRNPTIAPVKILQNSNMVSVAWNEDGTKLASIDQSDYLQIWDAYEQRISVGQQVCIVKGVCNFDSSSLWWHEDNQSVYIRYHGIGYDMGGILQWDLTTSQPLSQISLSGGGYFSTIGVPCKLGCIVNYSPTKEAAVYHDDDQLLVWDVLHEHPLFTLDTFSSNSVPPYYWSHDGRSLAVAIQEQPLQIYDVFTGQLQASPAQINFNHGWSSWQWSPDDRYLVEFNRGVITLWQRQ